MSRKNPTEEEIVAAKIIEQILGYVNVKNSDKPDIICQKDGQSIGIEVVSALPQDDKKLEKHIINKKLNRKEVKLPDTYHQIGNMDIYFKDIEIDKESNPKHITRIKEAIDKKSKKKKRYVNTDKIGLYIDCLYIISGDDENTKNKTKEIFYHIVEPYFNVFDFFIIYLHNEETILKITNTNIEIYPCDGRI